MSRETMAPIIGLGALLLLLVLGLVFANVITTQSTSVSETVGSICDFAVASALTKLVPLAWYALLVLIPLGVIGVLAWRVRQGTAFSLVLSAGLGTLLLGGVLVSPTPSAEAADGECIRANGSQGATANISWGGYSLTNLGGATWSDGTSQTTAASTAPTFVVCASNATNTGRCDYLADGVGDDVEINAAFTAGGTSTWVALTCGLFVGPSVGAIAIPNYGTLSGGGACTTFRRATSATGATEYLITNTDPGAGRGYNISLRDLTIDGNTSAMAPVNRITDVFFKNMDNLRVENVNFTNNEGNASGGIKGSSLRLDWCQWCKIEGNHFDGNDGVGLLLQTSVYWTTVSNNTFTRSGKVDDQYAIEHNNADDITYQGNHINNSYAGIRLVSGANNVIDANVIYEIVDNVVTASGYAIDVGEAAATPYVRLTTISNNIIAGSQNTAIRVDASSTGVLITGNIVNQHGLNGIIVDGGSATVIDNNYIVNNSRALPGVYSAIALGGTIAATGTVISNNIISDTLSADQQRGIREWAGDYNIITGNTIWASNVPIAVVGDNDIIRDNMIIGSPATPFVTLARGTATVANGSTTTTVTHTLATTPLARNCTVTPTNNLGNAAKFWADSFGATTFIINVDVDPGATTATFAWQCAIY